MTLNFLDNIPLLAQVHELQLIVNTLKATKIKPRVFQLGVTIAKLLSTWRDCRKKTLDNSKDFSLEQIH